MGYTLHLGDCLDILPTLAANSVDTVITDPPYGLSFMGKEWDHGVPGVQFWREALRVAKPGAMLLAFGGTRTFHRLTCAIEDAGWEVRDVVTWLYGSGFPKSLDISKAIDKAAGAEREIIRSPITMHSTAGKGISNELDERPWLTKARENGYHEHAGPTPATPDAQQWHGWGTALKPAWEPIILAMKPLDGTFAQNAQRWGVAGLNVDGCRIDASGEELGRLNHNGPYTSARTWNTSKTEAQDSRGKIAGRWPANLLLDEEAARALDAQSGTSRSPSSYRRSSEADRLHVFGKGMGSKPEGYQTGDYGDTGGASRFFYVAKASRSERNRGLEGMEARFCATMNDGIGKREHNPEQPNAWVQNHHPTVKPLALMRYLCRLTATPTGGVVLDPFMGSGTTGVAALQEGRRFIGVELDADYYEIARRRIEAAELPLMRMAAD